MKQLLILMAITALAQDSVTIEVTIPKAAYDDATIDLARGSPEDPPVTVEKAVARIVRAYMDRWIRANDSAAVRALEAELEQKRAALRVEQDKAVVVTRPARKQEGKK